MFIASKMDEVYPLRIKTTVERLGNKRFSKEDLIEAEGRIIKVLDYRLNIWSFFDLAMLKISHFANQSEGGNFLSEIDLNKKSTNNNEPQAQPSSQLKHLEQLCSFLSKFAVYDY